MSRTKKITKPHYELLYIVSNKYTEQEAFSVSEKIEKLIKDSDGDVTYKENWGKKKLAYPIKHFNHGYYFLIEFDLVGSKLNWVDTETKHMSEILRHQIVTKSKRSLEEIENENRILEKQAKRAAEKKAQAESEGLKASTPAKKSYSSGKTASKPKTIAEDKKESDDLKKEKLSKEAEVKKPKSKEEVQLNLDKLDEKLDKILNTDDLL